MRKLTSHKTNDLNKLLDIKVLDEPGAGGASHNYVIYRPMDFVNDELNACPVWPLNFQNGPPAEVGINGLTIEALLAIVEDRLHGFQCGPYASDDNKAALGHVILALAHLSRRSRERIARGVEGTHQE